MMISVFVCFQTSLNFSFSFVAVLVYGRFGCTPGQSHFGGRPTAIHYVTLWMTSYFHSMDPAAAGGMFLPQKHCYCILHRLMSLMCDIR